MRPPPISKVRTCPPNWPPASWRLTSHPARTSSYAAARPATPPPITIARPPGAVPPAPGAPSEAGRLSRLTGALSSPVGPGASPGDYSGSG